jgi:hypothetical protein
MKQQIIEKLIKLMSRKFIVFIVSCCFFYAGKIDANIWLTITIAYAGINLYENQKVKENEQIIKEDV